MDEVGLGEVARDPLVEAVDLGLADPDLGDDRGPGLEGGPLHRQPAQGVGRAGGPADQLPEQPGGALHVGGPGLLVELGLGGVELGLGGLLAGLEAAQADPEAVAVVLGGVQPLGQPLDLGVLRVELGRPLALAARAALGAGWAGAATAAVPPARATSVARTRARTRAIGARWPRLTSSPPSDIVAPIRPVRRASYPILPVLHPTDSVVRMRELPRRASELLALGGAVQGQVEA